MKTIKKISILILLLSVFFTALNCTTQDSFEEKILEEGMQKGGFNNWFLINENEKPKYSSHYLTIYYDSEMTPIEIINRRNHYFNTFNYLNDLNQYFNTNYGRPVWGLSLHSSKRVLNRTIDTWEVLTSSIYNVGSPNLGSLEGTIDDDPKLDVSLF